MLIKEQQLVLAGNHAHGELHEGELTRVGNFKQIVLGHYLNIPEDSRPASCREQDVDDFCNFFVSYLFSSFEYVEAAKPRLMQTRDVAFRGSTCWCDVCTRLTDASGLKLRRVAATDRTWAEQALAEAFSKTASAAGWAADEATLTSFLRDESLAESLAVVAYGIQLIRRMKGEESAASALVLWRRFAWKNGEPKKDFVLDGAAILRAEATVVSQLKNLR